MTVRQMSQHKNDKYNWKREKKRLGQSKGVLGVFMIFILMAVILTFLFAVGLPFLMSAHTEFYKAGEIVLQDIDLTTIQDVNVRNEINASLESAKSATTENISILSYFYQYAWVIIIIVILFILFMESRVIVETDIR